MRLALRISVALIAWLLPAAVSGSVALSSMPATAQDQDELNELRSDGMTVLHRAVFQDDKPLVEKLLATGAKPQVANRYGVTPLSTACENGNAEIVGLLLKAGADVNVTLRGGETPLMTAARTGIPSSVQALLVHGADVNARDRKQQTAIMWAAAEGNLDVVNLLIDAGADFKTPLASGFTPFFFAVREGRQGVALRLLQAGVNVNDVMEPERSSGNGPKPGTGGLLLAVENGHFELAAALLDAGADPNDGRCGYQALHAITWVRKPIRGDTNPPPEGSGTMSSLEFVRKLVAAGADVNARHSRKYSGGNRLNRTEATAFLLAAESSDIELMRLLMELGADPLLANAENSTPLLAAAGVGVLGDGDESAGTEEEAIAAVQLLLDWGANVNDVDDNGDSAMHGAAYQSRPELVKYLAEHGADVAVWNHENKKGWTPLAIAQGHRPGNFRPSPETIEAVEQALRPVGK